MLKLKYLFNNLDLATMILNNWEFDSVELFKYYRISSNAIYPFAKDGKTQLLRFAPKTEKSIENIRAELEFIAYLRDRGYGVLEAVQSKNGEKLVETETPWGEYAASVFMRVSGVQLNRTDLSDDIIYSYGKALGKLHQLSSEYTPTSYKRWSHREVLGWMQAVLAEFPQEIAAMNEAKLLTAYFDTLPMNNRNYGLIHYDFEFDNVFYDQAAESCNAIDFDDAMYHWYTMDIEQSLDSLQDVVPEEMYEMKKKIFLDGYQTAYELSEDDEQLLPACRRFANLYGYVRILRSTDEQWANEPEWLAELRERLSHAMQEESRYFGTNLDGVLKKEMHEIH
ncbi:phosphotransferase enzyme family protein [Paenibacillus sp. KN14-4R]|uniref:phosphotransferase enzyme family protein n=1 Tax=Paenibacillus sp. KN14-4R TaxID=3445773 RepID=UPI003FA0DC5E